MTSEYAEMGEGEQPRVFPDALRRNLGSVTLHNDVEDPESYDYQPRNWKPRYVHSRKSPSERPSEYVLISNQMATYLGGAKNYVYAEMLGLQTDSRPADEDTMNEAREAVFSAMLLNKEIANLPSELKLDPQEMSVLAMLIGKKPERTPEGDIVYRDDQIYKNYDVFKAALGLKARKRIAVARAARREEESQDESHAHAPVVDYAQKLSMIMDKAEQRLGSAISKCIGTTKFHKAFPDA